MSNLLKNRCVSLRHNAYYSKAERWSTIEDYTEIISADFNINVQSEHFGNRKSLPIDALNLDIIDKQL